MPQTRTFNFDITPFTASFNPGDRILVKFQLVNSNVNTYKATLSQGSVAISSTAPSTGYINVYCPYLTGSEWTAGQLTNEIVFTEQVSNLYGDIYQFNPNPESGSFSSSLYPYYGDVRYPFHPTTSDIVIMQLSDNSFFQATIISAYRDVTGILRLVLDEYLPTLVRDNINGVGGKTYKRFLLIKRYPDEQNVILQFRKPPGETSYGFIIPDTVTAEVLDNINTLQASVQTQLLSSQANTGTGAIL